MGRFYESYQFDLQRFKQKTHSQIPIIDARGFEDLQPDAPGDEQPGHRDIDEHSDGILRPPQVTHQTGEDERQ